MRTVRAHVFNTVETGKTILARLWQYIKAEPLVCHGGVTEPSPCGCNGWTGTFCRLAHAQPVGIGTLCGKLFFGGHLLAWIFAEHHGSIFDVRQAVYCPLNTLQCSGGLSEALSHQVEFACQEGDRLIVRVADRLR